MLASVDDQRIQTPSIKYTFSIKAVIINLAQTTQIQLARNGSIDQGRSSAKCHALVILFYATC